MSSKLYLIPTPIGNLEDITLRAIRILKEVDLILAEDTRTSSKLLKHYEISTRTESFHMHNEHKKVEHYVDLIEHGQTLALITDAGTPAISDPGFLLVRACLKNEIEVECLPGATAFVPALVNSGLPSERFIFEGFLPQKKGRNKRLEQLKDEERTIIFYESPYRLVKTLEQLAEHFSIQHIGSVSRELTKIYEETRTGSLEELIRHYSENPPKGEIVIVFSPKI
ncbi:MAG: 16S rRNA (cytidine(1402)-2'-O)-methyltransferase [Bacteroidales bacterium]|nr:16S rRNA (cytidine(1402)-2'-O)-methyltransferase [Bacteroidales bacterium]MBN2819227.1 16S rRNA (cytidine(1402)-2'-O)-methyltransferase [Bacteroidales bacterium]